MNIIYLILAHKNPGHLHKMIEALSSRASHFIIHVDSRVDIEGFIDQTSNSTSNIHYLTQRHPSSWGSFDIINATLTGFEFIVKNFSHNARINLMSGQDYPISSKKNIESFFSSYADSIFIEYYRLPNKKFPLEGKMRFPKFDQVNKICPLYGGSQWWSITGKTITLILEFISHNPSFLAYFRLVAIPDESFFQTLILNLENPEIQNNLVNKNLHFINWRDYDIHPIVLERDSFDSILLSKKLFARKFDQNASAALIEKIDTDILR